MGAQVSERIEMILKHFNLNQKQLAKMSNLPENTLSNAKKGKNIPNLEFFNSIYKALPVLSLQWLYMGEGSMISDPGKNPQVDELKMEIEQLKSTIKDKDELISLLKLNK
jgi:transcriptional regulator with XRE-family HTH domain